MPNRDEEGFQASIHSQSLLVQQTEKEILKLLQSAQDEVISLLSKNSSVANIGRLAALKKEITRTVASFNVQAADTFTKKQEASWGLGKDLVTIPATWHGIIGTDPSISIAQLQMMKNFATDRIRNISTETINRINGVLAYGLIGAKSFSQMVDGVQQQMEGSPRRRAITIVRTELPRAYSAAADETMKEVANRAPPGTIQKEWRRSGKPTGRPNHSAADRQVRDVDQPFDLITISMMYPRDPNAPPGETINCGCFHTPKINMDKYYAK